MSYTKQNWNNGDVITADKLNNIENGINNATGYDYVETKTVLFEGDVTAIAYNSGQVIGPLNLENPRSEDVLLVTFNNVEYFCKKMNFYGGVYGGVTSNGGYDFSLCPFVINGNALFTEQIGTYSVKIEAINTQTIKATHRAFDLAVNDVITNKNTSVLNVIISLIGSTSDYNCSHTGEYIIEVLNNSNKKIPIYITILKTVGTNSDVIAYNYTKCQVNRRNMGVPDGVIVDYIDYSSGSFEKHTVLVKNDGSVVEES